MNCAITHLDCVISACTCYLSTVVSSPDLLPPSGGTTGSNSGHNMYTTYSKPIKVVQSSIQLKFGNTVQ